jgi:hypothetical protein
MQKDEKAMSPAAVMASIQARVAGSMPGGIRGVAVASHGRTFKALVLSTALGSQRQHLVVDGNVSVAIFVENFVSVERAILSGLKPLLVRLLAEGILASDIDGALRTLQERAREAVRKPRPLSSAERLSVYSDLIQLLAELEHASKDPNAGQLVYSELLLALLRSRLVAERRWLVPASRLLEECSTVDPALSQWTAAALRTAFTTDMLPAVRVRVKTVTARFAIQGDAFAAPRFGLDDMMVGFARRHAAKERKARPAEAVSA